MKNSELSEQARKARNKYQSEYKKQNREKLNAYHKKWRAENKDKVRENNLRYWERKALKDVTDNVTDNLNVTDKRNISITCLNCGVILIIKFLCLNCPYVFINVNKRKCSATIVRTYFV